MTMRFYFSLLLILMSSFSASARYITPTEARDIACDFALKHFKSGNQIVESLTPLRARSVNEVTTRQPFYIYNFNNGGFVVVSSDSRTRQILAYSEKGSLDVDNLPTQLSGLFDYYSAQITALSSDYSETETSVLNETAEKLLTTSDWGQNYNSYTPVIDNVNSPVGCVATAMAIVMKYHNWPLNGRGSHKYNTVKDGMALDQMNYSDYSFDYSAMANGSADEIGRLMRCAGHSVNMTYGSEESTTYVWVVPNGLRRYFSYSPECQYLEKSHFTDAEWIDLIHTQIDEGLPVIYSGFDLEKKGHAFVIDGYKGELFHCNWGWNGMANGYYSINLAEKDCIPVYNNRQGMVINIRPDKSCLEMSPCWIDYGYLWREINDDPLAVTNPGTHVYPSEFVPGKPFDFSSKTINVPVDYSCSFGIAVLDADNNIIDVMPANRTIDEGTYTLFCGINYTWNGVKLNSSLTIDRFLPQGAKLCVVSQRKGSDKWKIIPGTIEASSSCAFDGSAVDVSTINYTFNNTDGVIGDPNNDVCDFSYRVTTSSPTHGIIGSTYLPIYKANNGVANIYVDGVWATNTDDMARTSLDFALLNPTYDITVDYIPESDFADIVLENVVPGSLEKCLDNYDHIGKLKLSGKLNADDIYFITRNCVSLQQLDLSDCSIVSSVDKDGIEHPASTFPKDASYSAPFFGGLSYPQSGVFGVKSLKMPYNLAGWESSIIGRNQISLSLPAGVDNGDGNMIYYSSLGYMDISYQFVYASLDENSTIKEVSFPETVSTYGKLFVPKSSASKFRSVEGWRDFSEIIETDKPYSGEIVNLDGAKFLILSDCAALISSPLNCPDYTVPDEIIFEENKYPVKYFATQAFMRAKPHVRLPKYFEKLDLNTLRLAVYGLTLNKNLKEIVPIKNAIYNLGGDLYLKNEAKLDLSGFGSYRIVTESVEPNFTGVPEDVKVFIPGATLDRFADYNASELWQYSIDRQNSRIAVIPFGDAIEIDRVLVNGVEVEGENGLYAIADMDNIDVVVEYTLNGRQEMLTHYDAKFNNNTPDSDLSSIRDIVEADKKMDIYNVSGILIKKQCDMLELNKLPNGVYIIRQGNKTFKRIIFR